MNTPTANSTPDELANLKDIHLPDAISWWPLAPGWWILLALIIITVFISIYARRYWLNNKAYRKEALRELQKLQTKFALNSSLSSIEFIEELATLIRRTAISTSRQKSSKTHIAQIQGKEWQTYLAQSMPVAQAEIIAIARYKSPSTLTESDKEALYQAVKQWIKGHKVLPEEKISRGQKA